MGGIRVGVQEADGQRLDPVTEQPIEDALDLRGVEGNLHVAAGGDPLGDFHAKAPLDERRRFLPGDVVETRHAETADLQHVTEALRRDEPGPRAPELEDRVRGNRGAVQDLAHVVAGHAGFVEQLTDALDDGAGVVVDARRHLLRVDGPIVVQEHDVGERPADVDADAKARHLSGRPP